MSNERPKKQVDTYTHGHKSFSAHMAQRTAEEHAWFFLPYLKPGMRMLDGGCGPGTITIGLGRAIRPGEAIGIDIAPSEIEKSLSNAQKDGTTNVRFQVASIYEIPFPDRSFDAVFSHTVLEHVREPDRGLKEMHRVLKPGGVIGLRGTIMRSHVWYPEASVVTETYDIYTRMWLHNHGHPNYGLEQADGLRKAGFVDIKVSASFLSEMHEGLATIVAPNIIQPEFVRVATEQGWADQKKLQQLHDGLVEWSGNQQGQWFPACAEAIAWKK